MKRLLLTILITVSLLSGGATSQAANSYFPLTVGNTWNYKVVNPDGACSLSNEVLPDGRIKSFGCWGGSYSYVTLVVSSDGIRTVRQEVGGVIYTASPGSDLIPANMSAGNAVTTTYSYTDPDGTGSETEKVTVIGVESVTVPAGTFSAVKVKKEITGYSQPDYSWYAAGVGLVKHVTYESSQELTSSSLTGSFGSLTLSPTGKDFGAITTNTASTSQAFTLSNSGSANLTVSGFSLLYGTPSEFSINTGNGSSGSCGPTPTIVPGGNCTIGVTFNPISVGEKETGLHIYSNDPATPDKIATLNGIGELPSYTVTAVAEAGGSLNSGVTPSPATTLHGYDLDFIFNANSGYYVSTVSGCNGTAYTNTDQAVASRVYTTGPVTANCTVTATFAALAVNSGSGGSFTITGSMNTSRSIHTATLLNNGKVLVTGGTNTQGASALNSAELYDPATRTFTPTGNLITARMGHTATLLPSGKVLIAGGTQHWASPPNFKSAELYDPATGVFTTTGSLATGRYVHTATLLPNGKVLIAGGSTFVSRLNSAELYDPAAGSFSPTGSMNAYVGMQTATLLSNGKVLIAGGFSGNTPQSSAELYDYTTAMFSAAGSMSANRAGHSAVGLSNGKVLITSGQGSSGYLTTAELYNPVTNSFLPTGGLSDSRLGHTATLLANGKVLVAGGLNSGGSFLATTEVYDQGTGTFSLTAAMNFPRHNASATALANGKVLIVGGQQGTTFQSSAELYNLQGVPAPLPKTGQTTCYDEVGATITCAGTGQDGEIQAGVAWPDPRFVDNGDQTVTDKLTGLVWSKDANPAGGTKTWLQALNYIKTLNSQIYLGHSDWRLPNVNELDSLLTNGQVSTSDWLNAQGVANFQSHYWSSSTCAAYTDSAWGVNMQHGYVNLDYKYLTFYVWPVRTGQSDALTTLRTGQTTCYDEVGATISCIGTGQDGEMQAGVVWPEPRFEYNGDQTVTDKLTGLIWSKDANPAEGTKTWQQALDYIKVLNSQNYLSKSDWRLPNVDELDSLVNIGQISTTDWLNTQGIANAQYYYWSSSTNVGYTNNAEIVYLNDGDVYVDAKYNYNYVWPVRSGQSGSFASMGISPEGKDFGAVSTNTASPSQTFTISNTGSANLVVSSFGLLYGTASEFSIITGNGSGGSCGPTPIIVPGGSCTIEVTFNPTSVGEKETGLHIYSNDPATPDKIVTLNGIGVLPSYNVTAVAEAGGSLNSGVTPSLATTLHGYDLDFIFNANSGYYVSTVSGCNGTAYTNTDQAVASRVYTTGPITADCTVTATFAASAVNGICGSANGSVITTEPTTNLCASGSASTVTGSGHWNWSCSGSNGGINAACTAYLQGKPAVELPRTGQTTCWDEYGVLLASCSGTGQDGEVQAGVAWPDPRFVDNGDQTVIDKLTGLIWSKNANQAAETKTWQGALDYIKTLNSTNYLGHNDWRLPNINELESINSLGQALPATWLNGQGFNNVEAGAYWSSTTLAIDSSYIFVFYMSNGLYQTSARFYSNFVWPVRNGQSVALGSMIPLKTGQTNCYNLVGATIPCEGTGQDGELQAGVVWPTSRFAANVDQTITDNLTGLVWSKDASPAGETKSLRDALNYIKTLNSSNYLGYSDWRLPNINELKTLVSRCQLLPVAWLNEQGFTNVQSDFFWSSSTVAFITGSVWGVNMVNGDEGYGNRGTRFNVWPVRGGQTRSFGSLTVSPDGKDFGAITTNTASPSQTFTLSNSGAANLIVSDFGLDPDQGSGFNISSGDGTGGTCGPNPTINPGGNCTFSVTFTPTSIGAKSVALFVHSNDPVMHEKVIFLNGTGVLPSYTIDATVTGNNGTVNCTAQVSQGGTCTCTITPNSGYQLATLTDNGTNVFTFVSGNSYTINNVTDVHNIVATYTQQTFTMPVTVPGGNGTVSCTAPVYNGVCTCTVTPLAGYRLASLTDNGANVFTFVSGNSYIINNVTDIHTINATFEQISFSMPVTIPGGNGTVSCTAPVYNGVCTCTVTPLNGYRLASLTDNGANVFTSVSGNSYTINNVTDIHTINATFEQISFTMPVTTPGGNGTVSCTAPVYNGVCTCTITPAIGYQLATLTDNGVNVFTFVSGNSYTINNVTDVHNIVATYTQQTFTMPVTVPGGNGTVSCTAPVYNGVCTCTVTPALGYQLATLTDNGDNVFTSVSGNSYTINNVTDIHTINATFEQIIFTMPVIVPGGNGTVSCTSPVYNGVCTCTITPALGYELATLTDNGTNVFTFVSGNSYIIHNVTEEHSIAATFAQPPVNGICGSANGSITGTKPITNLCSDNATPTVSGSGPWSWTCSGSNGGTDASCAAYKPEACTTDYVPVCGTDEITYSNSCVAALASVPVAYQGECKADGACGSANGTVTGTIPGTSPATSLCSAGAASAVSGTGPWFWKCVASASGITAYCSANNTAAIREDIQIDTASCPLVKIYATVIDQAGNPVGGLIAKDFVVKEDAVIQLPITVTNSGQSEPVSVALTLDYSSSMDDEAESNMEKAAVSFVNQLGAQDAAEIVKFSSSVATVQAFTTDKSLLASAIKASWSGGVATALYDAVYKAIMETGARGGRMAVIAMTDGKNNLSTHSAEDVISLALAKGVPVFTVGLGDVETGILEELANRTGGVYYHTPNSAELQTIYSRIASIINNQYIITYNTTSTNPASRTVTVDVSSGGNSVTASRIYSGCALSLAVNGSCGSSNGTTLTAAPADNLCSNTNSIPAVTGSGPWNWTCTGQSGGSDVTCMALKLSAIPGDSDGDGVITIAEVQSAINMFLGLNSVAGYVDSDGTGAVSIAEVQKVINGFLGL